MSSLSQNFLKWRLFDIDLVDNWVHPSGKAVLLGDAVHPMLPYMASGAAMACEDAAVLRQVLKPVSGSATHDSSSSSSQLSSLKTALLQYQAIRQPRVSYLQKAGRRLQYEYHLADGPLQRDRDAWMTRDDRANPVFWGHEDRRVWLFGYDAEKDAVEKLRLWRAKYSDGVPPAGREDGGEETTASTDFYCQKVLDDGQVKA